MDDTKLLSHLQLLEEDSAQFTFGSLAAARRRSAREYFRRPYGDEEEGWSQIITSDVQDTIEWLVPGLVDIFLSTDKAVEFRPRRQSEVQGAQQATDACNYVFYQQNCGELILQTLFRDALMYRNCAVHWRSETIRSKEVIPVRGATAEMLAEMMEPDDKVEGAEETEVPVVDQATGQPVLNAAGQPVTVTLISAKISRITMRKVVRVEAFEPENLLVKRDWTSPLLEECPYVARIMPVTLSDLKMMGFDDVTADELAASEEPGGAGDWIDRKDRKGGNAEDETHAEVAEKNTDDESMTSGWLRIEWVLADVDGDGIAERREIYRLKDRILSKEECPEVPIATASPILVQHRWEGLSLADLLSDLQALNTELTRGVVNNAKLANNPRKTVLVDRNGAPLASIDDLLDGRPGGIVQQKQADAIGFEATPFVGNQMEPLLQRIDMMREQRTGVTKQRMGIDPNMLRPDRTLGETQIIDTASQQRTKLIARNFAVLLVKPIFRGIKRLLTEGDMDKLAFELRGEFVELDPNDWRDSYDMTINVGLGTGDTQNQLAVLAAVRQTQMQIAPSPLGKMMITPKQIFTTNARMLELSGFKNVGEFFTDPGNAPLPEKPPEPPPPQVLVAQMRQQTEGERLKIEAAAKEREQQNAFELQRANDERDATRELKKAEYEYQLQLAEIADRRYATDANNKRAIAVAHIQHPESPLPPGWGINVATGELEQGPDPFAILMAGMETINAKLDAPAEIVRDPATGRPVGVMKGGQVRPIVRDEAGRVVGHG